MTSRKRSAKPEKARSAGAPKSGPGTAARTVAKKAGRLFKSPVARDILTAGVVTTVATKVATTSARKAAREEVAQGGGAASPGAILGTAVATVASEAMQRLARNRTKKTPAQKKAALGSGNTKARSGASSLKGASKSATRRPSSKKRSSSRTVKS
jgi:hypothetical protein